MSTQLETNAQLETDAQLQVDPQQEIKKDILQLLSILNNDDDIRIDTVFDKLVNVNNITLTIYNKNKEMLYIITKIDNENKQINYKKYNYTYSSRISKALLNNNGNNEINKSIEEFKKNVFKSNSNNNNNSNDVIYISIQYNNLVCITELNLGNVKTVEIYNKSDILNDDDIVIDKGDISPINKTQHKGGKKTTRKHRTSFRNKRL